MLIRLYRYAQEHLDRAELIAEDLKDVWSDMELHVREASHEYMTAINNGSLYVPVDFMRSSNEFEGDRVRLEDTQKQLLANLCISLTFCGEMISYIISHPKPENLKYRKPIRLIVERIFLIVKLDYMRHSSKASLLSIAARIESSIILSRTTFFDLLRRIIATERVKISKS